MVLHRVLYRVLAMVRVQPCNAAYDECSQVLLSCMQLKQWVTTLATLHQLQAICISA